MDFDAMNIPKTKNRLKRTIRYSFGFVAVAVLVLVWFAIKVNVSWGDNPGEDILYMLLCFFAFPINWILEWLHVHYGMIGFALGVLMNCFFYGLILELSISLCRKLIIKKTNRQA